ncbi:MAG: transcription repressor NadR [Lachnospiraceae bacterium]|nr:transcription repressor NadR [Lachnospiraceae bacterium]
MTAQERRQQITDILNNSPDAISASSLAASCGVSRQIIVGDVALLRASGLNILATPRGYILENEPVKATTRIACCHDAAGMHDELYAIVDEGCTIENVIVEHPIYGQLTASLQLSSRHDVDEFMQKNESADARPLSMLTEGIHLHTLTAADEAVFVRVREKLTQLGILLSGDK